MSNGPVSFEPVWVRGGFKHLQRALQDEFDAAADTASDVLENGVRDEIIRDDAFASRTLLNNITSRRLLVGRGRLNIDVTVNEGAYEDGTPLGLVANVLETGSEPSDNPHPSRRMVKSLLRWIKDKSVSVEGDPEGAAYAMATVILQEGQEGRHTFQRALRKNKFRVVTIFRQAAARAVKKYMKE